MNRQFTPDELEIFYHSIGKCIWHLQYLEDVLHTFLTLKIDIRTPGRVSLEQANQLLAKRRRATLGTSLRTAEENNVLPPDLLAKLNKLKEERDWLVHRSILQNGDSLYNDEGRNEIFVRLKNIMQSTNNLKKEIVNLLEVFYTSHGLSLQPIKIIVSEQMAELKGKR